MVEITGKNGAGKTSVLDADMVGHRRNTDLINAGRYGSGDDFGSNTA